MSRQRTAQVEVPTTAVYTSGHPLEKGPKTAHFFSLFGPSGVSSTCRYWIHKPFHARQIELETRWSLESKTPCACTNPKFSHRFSLIVHYFGAKSPSSMSPSREGLKII